MGSGIKSLIRGRQKERQREIFAKITVFDYNYIYDYKAKCIIP